LLELPNPAVSHLAITLAAKYLGENTKNPALTTQHSQRQVTLPKFPNPALPNCCNCTGGKLHLVENIKNLALTNPAFTAASHFARITKSGIVKFGDYSGSKVL